MADSTPVNNKESTQTEINKKKKYRMKPVLKKVLRQILIFLVSLAIVVGSFFFVVKTLYDKFLKPVDPEDDTRITVEVPMGTTINGISDILYKNDLIRNASVFKLAVDLSNKNNKMQAGKYELAKSMTIPELIDEFMTGQVSVTTVSITIREGDDIVKIAERLVNDYNLDFTEVQFIEETKKVEKYEEEFSFLKDIPEARRSMKYPMEGYLFPETYYVYADSNPERIIRTMLRQFENTFSLEMQDLAEEKGLSMDDVVTLASIIQSEAITEEFTKVSAVFHNRLSINMRLQADATINYVLEDKEVNQITLTREDMDTESPYNTYKVDGLPMGPISSPGKAALEAVLNPFPDYMDKDKEGFMLYYTLIDPDIGLHAFNTNLDDHNRDTNKYSPNWKR